MMYVMNDENWYNYLTRREGTIFGDLAKKNMDDAMKSTSYTTPPKTKHLTKTPKPEKSTYSATPVKKPISIFSILIFFGLAIGVIYLVKLDWSSIISIIIFGAVVVLLVPLVKFLIKIVAFIIKVSITLFIIYLIAQILISAAN